MLAARIVLLHRAPSASPLGSVGSHSERAVKGGGGEALRAALRALVVLAGGDGVGARGVRRAAGRNGELHEALASLHHRWGPTLDSFIRGISHIHDTPYSRILLIPTDEFPH